MARSDRRRSPFARLLAFTLAVFLAGLLLGLWLGKRESYRLGYLAGRAVHLVR